MTADAIAMKLGIEKTAMVRVRAGIGYALRSESMGDISTSFSPSMLSRFRASGAAALLAPWRVRRAGAI